MTAVTKIAVVASSCPPLTHGGVATSHYNLFLFLQSLGYEVRFFTHGDIQASSPGDASGISRYRIPGALSFVIRRALALFWKCIDRNAPPINLFGNINAAVGAFVVRRRVRRYAPDILIVPDRNAVGLFIGKPKGCRVIHISHHNPSRFNSALFHGFAPSVKDMQWAILMEQKGLRYADVVVCPSRYMLSCFRNTFSFDAAVEVIANLVEVTAGIAARCASELFGDTAIDGIVHIPDCGAANKGERYIYEIVRRIHKARPETGFYLSGSLSSVGERELETLELRGRLYAPGKLPYEEHLGVVAACSVCVSPSLTESYGMAFCETGLLGVPIVAFDSGGVRDIIEHGKTGYIVPLLDVDELVGKALELLGDSRKRQAFAEAGKARLNGDMDRARKSWEELITQTGGADEA